MPVNPLAYLCVHDERNPIYADLHPESEDRLSVSPRDGCACDMCFYGKDALALEIIRLREALEEIRDQSQDRAYEAAGIASSALNHQD